MADKAVAGVTNLLQRLALAIGGDGTEAKVEYAPVTRAPYVRVTAGETFDGAERVRGQVLLALVEKGFVRHGEDGVLQLTGRGHVVVGVEGPSYDPVGRRAFLDLTASGPHRSPPDPGRPRDLAAARATFERHRRQADDERFLRAQGAASLVRTLLVSAPFKVAPDAMRRIVEADPEVLRRVARAFAGQRLSAFEDLVSEADLAEVIGLEPAAPAP